MKSDFHFEFTMLVRSTFHTSASRTSCKQICFPNTKFVNNIVFICAGYHRAAQPSGWARDFYSCSYPTGMSKPRLTISLCPVTIDSVTQSMCAVDVSFRGCSASTWDVHPATNAYHPDNPMSISYLLAEGIGYNIGVDGSALKSTSFK